MNASYLSGSAEDQPVISSELPSKHVLVYVPEGYVDSEVACMLDVLGWTHYRPRFATVSVDTVGMRKEVHGGFGTCAHVDMLFEEVDSSRYDAFVLPGGFHNRGFDEAYDGRVAALAADFKERGCPIATLCVGVVPLAKAGLLAGGKATTYAFSSRHDNQGALRENGCEVVEEPVVEWNGIISCSGPAHSEQVAYRLLEMLVGVDAVADVRRYRNGVKNGK